MAKPDIIVIYHFPSKGNLCLFMV